MTRFCQPPQLVGARYWLPPQPFEFGWTYGVGCNNLRCERCGRPVDSSVLPDGGHRHYACGCQEGEEDAIYPIVEDWDMYPAVGPAPRHTEWVCGGHPCLVLPTVLDGVRLDTATDWHALVTTATLHPPFQPPNIQMHAAWITRLYRLLDAERALLSRAVAGLLSAGDPRLVRAAYDFFIREREAVGIEHVAGSVAARREWLSATPDPHWPRSSLLEPAASVLHQRLLVVDDANTPVDQPALKVAKELALAGVGPGHALLTFEDYDPEWLWIHARALIQANADWVGMLVQTTVRAPAARREQILRDVAEIAPRPVREEIEAQFQEPERSALLSSIWK